MECLIDNLINFEKVIPKKIKLFLKKVNNLFIVSNNYGIASMSVDIYLFPLRSLQGGPENENVVCWLQLYQTVLEYFQNLFTASGLHGVMSIFTPI